MMRVSPSTGGHDEVDGQSIFVRRERGVGATFQHHRAALLCCHEQLVLRSAEVADLTSWCVGLKEEGTTDRAKVCRLADKVRRMKAEADLRQEEMRQMKGNLQVVMVQWDKSRCQVAEASLHVDSLSKHLEAERSEGQALKARIGGILLKPCLIF
jgi:chromosome segregation ATPase